MTCLGENIEKYFTVPIEREATRNDKNGEEVTKNISYILQFVDSARFMASIELNVNTDTMIKNVKFVELYISIATVFLNAQTLKMI